MKNRFHALEVLVAVGLLILAGFAFGGPAAFAGSAMPRGVSTNQSWLGEQVRRQLVTLPWYGVFDNLQYRISGDNEVILEGQVVDPVTKGDAEKAVRRIEGVTRVVNNIEVLPVSPFDNQTRRAEYRTIYSQPQLSRYSLGAVPQIHIIVKNGHVTLEGVVANETDRNVAALMAGEVHGVFSVTNHLQVG
jgi:hyperosmotically inducible protein